MEQFYKRQTVPTNARRDICVKGYAIMKKYWIVPEGTYKTIDSNRWLRSGDVGTLYENGYLSIVGRIKDMIIRGGRTFIPKKLKII